jgi:hypothetical protein
MKRLLILITIILFNSNSFAEVKSFDSFFSNIGGRFSYKADFDKNDNIIQLIEINDFKQLKSSNGCFNINDFSNDSKIYQFLKKNNLKNFCNK